MTQLDQARVNDFKRNVRAEYDRYSVVRKLLPSRETLDDRDPSLVQIGNRFHIPQEVLTMPGPGTSVEPNVTGIGQSIAFGEERYLVTQLLSFISNRQTIDEFSFTRVTELLMQSRVHPRSVLIPIDFYSLLHTGKVEFLRIDYEHYDPYLILGPFKMRIYWSNKYVPFRAFIFVGNTLGQWVLKPDLDGHGLTLVVEGLRQDKVDVIVETVAGFDRREPQDGLIVGLPEKSGQTLH